MSKRILLVDDSDTVIMFEKLIFRGVGFEVVTAKNGKIALAEVAKRRPDLVLLDLLMPELNGIETCRRLKDNPETRDVPIVVVTTKDKAEMVEQAFEAGCDAYITKPVDKVELLAKVQTYLR
jgi:CheY-like chemotaxis protein